MYWVPSICFPKTCFINFKVIVINNNYLLFNELEENYKV